MTAQKVWKLCFHVAVAVGDAFAETRYYDNMGNFTEDF